VAEAERVKPRALYVEEAVQAALESRWQDALAINRALVERHGGVEETFNRIGKALTELGEHQAALDAYSQALQINSENVIAQKNVRKLRLLLESREKIAGAKGAIDVDLFAEEPGKSALTVLNPPKSGVVIVVARRLVPLISTGNRYTAVVARAEESQIEIIIREAFQSTENARKSSFPVSRQRREEFRPYAKESLLAQRGVDEGATADGNDEDVAEAGGTGEEAEPLASGEEFEEPAPLEDVEKEDDDVDEDVRPEDQY